MGSDDESPFAQVPASGIHETPSPMTPMGEVAAYGVMARGIRSRSRIVGRLVGVLFLLLLVGSVLFGVIGWLFLDDDSDSFPDDPPVPSTFVVPTAPSGVPIAPPPTVPTPPG